MLAAMIMLLAMGVAMGAEESKAAEKNLSTVQKVTEEVKEKVVAENKTAEPAKAEEKKTPGFEGVFAVAGLLAVAYLVLGRRE
jgi:PGF-CTERM protein